MVDFFETNDEYLFDVYAVGSEVRVENICC